MAKTSEKMGSRKEDRCNLGAYLKNNGKRWSIVVGAGLKPAPTIEKSFSNRY